VKKKSIKENFSDKLENFHINFYDMEQNISLNQNVFQDFTYINGNLIKQKEKLFSRGKWAEWQLNKSQHDSNKIDLMLKKKNVAFTHMLPQVLLI